MDIILKPDLKFVIGVDHNKTHIYTGFGMDKAG